MSSKAYSNIQREEIRVQLLNVALEMYAKKGFKETKLIDILEVVGISKPFFYKFFSSVQELVIQVLEFQWEHFTKIIAEIESNNEWSWKKRAEVLFDKIIHHQEHGIFIMTQEEEVWIKERLDEERYHNFMENQACFFQNVLELWEIPSHKCDSKTFGNLIISMAVIHNSAKRALPFLYLDKLEDTAKVQAKAIITYLEVLKKEA